MLKDIKVGDVAYLEVKIVEVRDDGLVRLESQVGPTSQCLVSVLCAHDAKALQGSQE